MAGKRRKSSRGYQEAQEQTKAFEAGKAISFYTRKIAKKLLRPTAEDLRKIARKQPQ